MMRSLGFRLVILLLGIGFVLGLAWVFRFQFQAGGSYPEGSSLRADPKGTMILCESLQQQASVEVTRNFDPPGRFRFPAEGTVLVLLQASPRVLSDPYLRRWVAEGGRVVTTPGMQMGLKEDEEEETAEPSLSPVAKIRALAGLPRQWETATFVGASETAPPEVPWRKAAVLQEAEGAVLYTLPMGPVVVRIQEGRGEWLVLSHPGLFLNRTQYEFRETRWLAWLFEDAERIVFDEAHFGIQQPRGVMTLMREAGLDVLLWAMVLPLGLACWRGICPLLPVVPEGQEVLRAPLSRLEGYRNLLARHVPASRILSHAVEEWKRDVPERTRTRLQEQITLAEELAKAKVSKKHMRVELREHMKRISHLFSPPTRAHHE